MDINSVLGCSGVLVMDGWTTSRGATLEVMIARELKKGVYYAEGKQEGEAVTEEAMQKSASLPQASVGAGGVKYDQGKIRFDLIPGDALYELARVYTIGSRKYADRNWERGMSWGRVFAAMMRHAWKWWGGERLDSVDGQHHLASVAWCAFALMTYEMRKLGTDDRSIYDSAKASIG